MEFTRATAWKIVGGLSEPSKMPGFGYSLPPEDCPTGSKLRNVENSVCSRCYAYKGRYVFPLVRAAMKRRLKSVKNKHWVEAMAYLLNNQKTSNCFRWHDSGDVQNMQHLMKIFEVCRRTPTIKHWLPTHERLLLKEIAQKHIPIPTNLNIRLSSCMIDAPVRVKELGIFNGSSTFVGEMSERRKKVERVCNAPKRKGECGNCRLCWNPLVKAVSYKLH
jgi:hypothetical protein